MDDNEAATVLTQFLGKLISELKYEMKPFESITEGKKLFYQIFENRILIELASAGSINMKPMHYTLIDVNVHVGAKSRLVITQLVFDYNEWIFEIASPTCFDDAIKVIDEILEKYIKYRGILLKTMSQTPDNINESQAMHLRGIICGPL